MLPAINQAEIRQSKKQVAQKAARSISRCKGVDIRNTCTQIDKKNEENNKRRNEFHCHDQRLD